MGWVSDELSNLEDEVKDVGRRFEDEVIDDVFGGYEGAAAAVAAPFVLPAALPALASAGGTLASGAGTALGALGSLGSSALGGLGSLGGAALGGLGGLGGLAQTGLSALGGLGGGQGGLGGLLGLATDYYTGDQTKDAIREASQLQAQMFERGITSAEDAQRRFESGLAPFTQFGAQALSPLAGEIGFSLGQPTRGRMAADFPGVGPIRARQGVAQQQAGLQAPVNPLLEQASEMAQVAPGNQLLQRAGDLSMQGSQQFLSPEILNNPLLQALQSDVTNRLMANQAARGKLGSGGTAEALQQALVPQAIQFGLQQAGLQQQDISNLAGLGATQADLTQRQLGNLQGLGATQEDLRQRGIENLFRSAGIGQASAAQTGLSGVDTAATVGRLSGQLGGALAFDPLGRAQARNQQLGGLQSFLTR